MGRSRTVWEDVYTIMMSGLFKQATLLLDGPKNLVKWQREACITFSLPAVSFIRLQNCHNFMGGEGREIASLE